MLSFEEFSAWVILREYYTLIRLFQSLQKDNETNLNQLKLIHIKITSANCPDRKLENTGQFSRDK